jgi:proline iminopeptidase
MNKTLIWILVGAAVVLVVLGYLAWQYMQKPMYTVGMASAQPVTVPPQTNPTTWTMEPGIELHYFTQGEGRPVLIIHGGPGAPYTEPIAALDALADQYAFYYYDQRGCGQSTRPIDRFTSKNYGENVTLLDDKLGMATQLADIERIRRILGEEKLILIGHSFGGLLASLYAAEFPEHVEALVLISPAEMVKMPPPEGGLYESIKAYLPQNMQDSYQAYIKDYLNFGKIFQYSEADLQQRTLAFTAYYQTAMQKKGMTIPESNNSSEVGGWMPFALYFGIGSRNDFTPALKVVTAPVLILHGEDDFQSINVSYLYSEAFPNSRVESIADAGHFSFADQPQQFIQLLKDFLPE